MKESLGIFLLALMVSLTDDKLSGHWERCQQDKDDVMIERREFLDDRYYEILMYAPRSNCSKALEDVDIALVTEWSYQLDGEEIEVEFESEFVVFFDPTIANENGVYFTCKASQWMKDHDPRCIKLMSDIPKLAAVREVRQRRSFNLKNYLKEFLK